MKRQKGLTLLELLVVIAIIALLAAQLVPALAQAKRSAVATVDVSNMRQLYAGLVMYENDYDGILPKLIGGCEPYVKEARVFNSSLDPRPVDRHKAGWTPDPCGPRGYPARSTFKISYPYSLSFYVGNILQPFGKGYEEWRTNPKFGLIASPWVGKVEHWSGEVMENEDMDSAMGPFMSGPILRIQMDGSLHRLPVRMGTDFLGGSFMDLFIS